MFLWSRGGSSVLFSLETLRVVLFGKLEVWCKRRAFCVQEAFFNRCKLRLSNGLQRHDVRLSASSLTCRIGAWIKCNSRMSWVRFRYELSAFKVLNQLWINCSSGMNQAQITYKKSSCREERTWNRQPSLMKCLRCCNYPSPAHWVFKSHLLQVQLKIFL